MIKTPGFGWIPDIPSVKDYTPATTDVQNLISLTNNAKAIVAAAPIAVGGGAAAAPAPALAPTVDLRAYCSPIEDQKTIGSCTANAAAALFEYFQKRACGSFTDASRLFIYKTTRDLLGWKGDTGAYLRTTMEAMVLFGAPPEQYWPYDVTKFDNEPTAFCYAFGQNFQAVVYYRLDSDPVTKAPLPGATVVQNIKTYLAAGFPSMFGFPVYDEYMHVPANGLVAFPATSSKLYGGHANVYVGYDDNLTIGPDKGAFLVRNSWGTGWGLKGYAWMPYRYISAGLATDVWSMLQEKWVKLGQF